MFSTLFGQDGTEEFDSISAAVVGHDASVILAGYSIGNWSGTALGRADFAAVKLDAGGNELWRWQVCLKGKRCLAAVILCPTIDLL